MATPGERAYVRLQEAKKLVAEQVRSFDFADGPGGRDIEGEHACFVQGEVLGITDPDEHPVFRDCPRYVIHVTRKVSGGKERTGGATVMYPPINGTPTWSGSVMDGVERLTTLGKVDRIIAERVREFQAR